MSIRQRADHVSQIDEVARAPGRTPATAGSKHLPPPGRPLAGRPDRRVRGRGNTSASAARPRRPDPLHRADPRRRARSAARARPASRAHVLSRAARIVSSPSPTSDQRQRTELLVATQPRVRQQRDDRRVRELALREQVGAQPLDVERTRATASRASPCSGGRVRRCVALPLLGARERRRRRRRHLDQEALGDQADDDVRLHVDREAPVERRRVREHEPAEALGQGT